MKAFLSQLSLDARVAWRGKFLHVTLGMSLVFALLLRFALPAHLDEAGAQYFADASTAQLFGGVGDEIGQEAIRPDAASVREATVEDSSAVGVVMRGTPAQPGVTFVIQGSETPNVRGLMEAAATKSWLDRGTPGETSHTLRTLRAPQAPPPFNQSWLPLIFGLDTVILGFFFAGVMILQEKQHGTVRFYRVSPGGTLRYVASKVAVLTAMALTGALLLIAIVAPHGLLIFELHVLLILATASLTLVGMGIAVFYSNLSSFFYPMAVVGLTLSLPMIAYGLPAASLPGLEFVPTWGVMFAGRELLFPAGRESVVIDSLRWLGVVFAASSVLGTVVIHRVLMRERA
ncbi:MAG: ABC transporter permease [Deltaproteobacteria bacterium]|nr:ABC transporter permease [Deltaproteobacteria bacterium]